MIYSRIAGTGSYLPKKVLTSAELENMVDTTEQWIISRTGVRERRIAAADERTSDLAEHASRQRAGAILHGLWFCERSQGCSKRRKRLGLHRSADGGESRRGTRRDCVDDRQ